MRMSRGRTHLRAKSRPVRCAMVHPYVGRDDPWCRKNINTADCFYTVCGFFVERFILL